MKKILMFLAAAMVFGSLQTVSAASVPSGKDADKKEESKKEDEESDYDKLFKDKKVKTVKGFVTLHKADDKVYMEIPDSVFGKDLMMVSVVSEISDHMDCHPGSNPMVPLKVAFNRIGNSVDLTRDKNYTVGDGDPNIEKAVERNTLGAVLQSFEIKACTPDSSAVVIDMTKWLTGSDRLLTPIQARSEGMYMLKGVSYSYYDEGSYLDDVKAFANNVTVTCTMTYKSNINPVYTRYTTAKVDRIFMQLPETEMKKRDADYRLPIQVTGRIRYRHDFKQAEEYYYCQRWRLEPADQEAFDRGEGSEVKKPIVFYVDTTFTPLLKSSIIEGVGEWNKAFEKVGYKNVIQFRDYPSPDEDPVFDEDNFDYNVIRFIPSLSSGATVRTFTDPRSGEILRTTIGVCYNFVADVPYDLLLTTAHADPATRTMQPSEEKMHDYIKYYFMWLAGVDCFGMTYNLTSSAAFPTDSLRSASFTQKYGTTPSMLDRAISNTAAPIDGALKGIRMCPTGLGEYDYFIVDWLYRPFREGEDEKAILKKMVDEKMGNPVYRYEYAKNCPDCGADDVGDDDLVLAGYQLENLRYMMANFDKWVSDEYDPDYQMRTVIYLNLARKYRQILTQIAINVYGIKTYQRMEGDPVPAYEYMTRDRQQKALDMLFEHVNHIDDYFRDDLLKYMPMQTKDLEDTRKDYIMLLMNTIGGSLFAYEAAPDDRIKHADYIEYQVDRLWKPTREGRELTDSEIYFQDFVFRSLLASTHMQNYKYKLISSDAERKALKIVDFGTEDKKALAAGLSDALYSAAYGDDSPLYSANYGTLKRWPVFHVQSSRYVYIEYVDKAYNEMKKRIEASEEETETIEHYRYLTDLYEIITDINK